MLGNSECVLLRVPRAHGYALGQVVGRGQRLRVDSLAGVLARAIVGLGHVGHRDVALVIPLRPLLNRLLGGWDSGHGAQ